MAGQVVTSPALRLAELLGEAESAVVLTGAGISVPSGIPDFRTPGTGIWENVDPMEVAHIDAFHRDTARFWSFYRPRFQGLAEKAPNAAPVNAANVKISLSTDGGETYPTTILASTPNDGSESVTVYGRATRRARIRIVSLSNPTVSDSSVGNISIR